MILSCCAWALTGSNRHILEEVAKAGFNWIDLRPFACSDAEGRQQLVSSDLGVSCVGVSTVLPGDLSLDSTDPTRAADALNRVGKGVQYAADLGASSAYVVPPLDNDEGSSRRFAAAVRELADQASAHGIKLCIEHAPGTALPTVVQTLDFIASVGHSNLYLLMDTGHLQMCGEDSESSIERAGDRLGYVHLDDNDGVGDLHLAPLDGVMTVESLSRVFTALKRVGYGGAVSVELSANLADPSSAIRRSRKIAVDIEPSLA